MGRLDSQPAATLLQTETACRSRPACASWIATVIPHGIFLSTTRGGDRPHHVEQVMKPPHGGVGQSNGLLVIRSWPAPCVHQSGDAESLGGAKAPEAQSAHAVSDVPRTHRKAALSLCRSSYTRLTRALRRGQIRPF